MSFLSFFGFYSKKKINDVARDVTSKIVSIDPEGATEAQLNMMLEKLHEISKSVARYRRAYEKDLQETEDWKKRLDETISAIDILQSDFESSSSESEKRDISKAIDKLLDEVDRIEKEVEREESEDRDAKEILDTYLEAEKDLAEKIKSARDSMKTLSRKIETAKTKRDIAKEKLKAEREKDGLLHSINSLSLANDYMKIELEQLQEEEEALRSQRELLSTEQKSDENKMVQDALSRVRKDSNSLSRADRLAKLKEKRR